MQNNHFKIIVPFYNVEKWIKKTFNSIKLQDYKDFQCVLVDDISTDSTADIIEETIQPDKRFKLVRNEEKKYPMRNIRDALTDICFNKEDIVVIVHGDDWLARPNVLTTLNEVYKKEDCWLTYGSYVEYPSGILGKFSKQLPEEVIKNNSFRDYQWTTSHLHTFKHGLWANLEEESFVEEPGLKHHFECCWDLAWMYPLLELAGKKSHYVSDTLYMYNRENPLNVDKINHQKQLSSERKIRSMPRYTPLQEI